LLSSYTREKREAAFYRCASSLREPTQTLAPSQKQFMKQFYSGFLVVWFIINLHQWDSQLLTQHHPGMFCTPTKIQNFYNIHLVHICLASDCHTHVSLDQRKIKQVFHDLEQCKDRAKKKKKNNSLFLPRRGSEQTENR
jgi:hypothetical protein